MKIEAGKRYVTTSGEIVGPMRQMADRCFRSWGDLRRWNVWGAFIGGDVLHRWNVKEEYTEPNTSSPMSTQVGGSNYKDMAIQPMEYSMRNNLNACQHTAIKYVSRYKTKGGKEDLEKAIHTIQMLISLEYP